MNRELLEKPFRTDQIKQRRGRDGMMDYIEGHAVVQRLNEAFEGEWTFEVQEHTILEHEVIVRGSLTAGGHTKTQFGSKEITRAKQDGSIISLGDDLKAATTDSLKKCATLFGVGLHLYEETVVAQPPATAHYPDAWKPKSEPVHATTDTRLVQQLRQAQQQPMFNNGSDGGYTRSAGGDSGENGRCTAKQLSAIFAIGSKAGFTQKDTRDFSKRMFGKLPDFLTKREASAMIDHLDHQISNGVR